MESNLVTVNDLKNFTTIGENVDEQLLFPFLIISQQLYLENVLGTALYQDIISRFDNQQLTGDTQYLYEEYIIPVVGWGALYSALPFIAYHIQRNGVMTMGTDTLTPTSPEELNTLTTRIDNLKGFYIHRLEDYLIANQALFPLYRRNNINEQNGGSIYTGYKRRHIHEKYWDLDGFYGLYR